MTQGSNELEKLKIFNDNIQSEARTHCTRNSYFLVIASILLLSLSQFDKYELKYAICSTGIILSLVWLLMHWRSGEYIKYWKGQAEQLSSSNKLPSIYPKGKISGIEIRILGLLLPFAFLILWFLIIGILVFIR